MIAAIKNEDETKVKELLNKDKDLLSYSYDDKDVRWNIMKKYFVPTSYFLLKIFENVEGVDHQY